MQQGNYWEVPNLRSVIIPIAIVDGQEKYPIDSSTSNLDQAISIVGLRVREPVTDGRTINASNDAAALVDATIYNGSILRLKDRNGGSLFDFALSDLNVKDADNWFVRINDRLADFVKGKSFIQVAATAANITSNAGKVIELEVFYQGNC